MLVVVTAALVTLALGFGYVIGWCSGRHELRREILAAWERIELECCTQAVGRAHYHKLKR